MVERPDRRQPHVEANHADPALSMQLGCDYVSAVERATPEKRSLQTSPEDWNQKRVPTTHTGNDQGGLSLYDRLDRTVMGSKSFFSFLFLSVLRHRLKSNSFCFFMRLSPPSPLESQVLAHTDRCAAGKTHFHSCDTPVSPAAAVIIISSIKSNQQEL